MIKIKVNKEEEKLLNNYIKGIRSVYSYVFSYKVKMYYNYLLYNFEYSKNNINIINLITHLDNIYSSPKVLFLAKKYKLDDYVVNDIINNVNNLFENYYIKKDKFPSLRYLYLYKVDKKYFVTNFFNLYNKYLLNYDLNNNNIYINRNENNELYLIIRK